MEINGYQIQGEFSAENAGCSVWARCRKNNHDFFIKKFTDVAYPLSNKLSPDLRRKKLLRCEEFFQKKQDFYRHLVQCRSGNIILVHDFFIKKCTDVAYPLSNKLSPDLRRKKLLRC